MKYRIGEAAGILGVSAETLRFFEQKGLVTPEKDASNRYRYFGARDLNRITAYRLYRGMGFSLDDTLMLLEASPAVMRDQMKRRNHELAGEIRRYQAIQRRIAVHTEALDRVLTSGDEFFLELRPHWWFLANQEGLGFTTEESQKRQAREWLECIPFLGISFCIAQSHVPDGDAVVFGYSLAPEFSSLYGLSLEVENAQEFRPEMSVRTTLRLDEPDKLSPRHLRPALHYIQTNGLRLCGDVSGWIVNEERCHGKYRRYFEAWLPVVETER